MRERDAVLIDRAGEIRRSMTDAEVRLWKAMRGRQLGGAKFSRQIAIAGHICDFACREHRLVVELDGEQHADQVEYDQRRDAKLGANGYRAMRFWNNEVFTNLDGVLNAVLAALPPLPTGEGVGGGRSMQGTGLGAAARPTPCPSPSGRGND